MKNEEKIAETKQEFLMNIECLMELIDNRRITDITEHEVQRQLGVCFYIWERLTRLQRGEDDE